MPKISVIVPVYNVEKYIRKCVDSLLAQHFDDLEIILVDDGSPDRCPEICDGYARDHAHVKTVHKPNGGLSDARNRGALEASGEYLAFIDSDDSIHPDMLATLYRLITENDADMAACGVYNCYDDGRMRPQTDKRLEFCCSGQDALKHMLEGKGLVNVWVSCKLYKRELCLQTPFRKGRLYEDVFFMTDMAPLLQKAAVTTEPLYYYLQRSDSITGRPFKPGDMDIIEAYRRCVHMVRKHYPQLKPQVLFRYYWAHFYLLDKLLLLPDGKEREEYARIVKILKKHTGQILANPYFTRARKLSAACLFLNAGLYQFISVHFHH